MPPADAVPRSEPSPEPVDVQPQAVPPPRAAPDVERTPAAPPRSEDPVPVAAPPTGEPAPDTVAPDGAGRPGGGDELTERERRILTFEQQWWRHAGAKEQAIRDTFGLSATRYYQLLNGLLDRPAALAAEPLLVGRLRRLRSSRTRNRRR
ncbi:DUF3263 domain-containing protein [Micromonospora sp. NPDC051925]|uniref:DUF3263 domain-containing protein n=1 Tax=Micromonospora sp. NPDC051925 TaxID=3364288 RepID=UPI0037C5E677